MMTPDQLVISTWNFTKLALHQNKSLAQSVWSFLAEEVEDIMTMLTFIPLILPFCDDTFLEKLMRQQCKEYHSAEKEKLINVNKLWVK